MNINTQKIKKRIRNILKRYPRLSIVILLFERKKDCEFIDFLRTAYDNPFIIEMKRGSISKMSPIPICKISVGNENEGFCAILRWLLDALYFCDQFGFIPIVQFNENCLYKDLKMNPDVNPFEYYFECQTNIFANEIENHPQVIYRFRNGYLAELLNEKCKSYEYSKEFVESLGIVMNKYISFNYNTKQIIEDYLIRYGINEECLGIHIRGTDYKKGYKNHPIYVEPDYYFPYINDAIKKHNFKHIFLATDDQDILKKFQKRYGNDVLIFYPNVSRTTGCNGVHIIDKDNGYSKGLELIIDIASLSACGGIISGLSQVSLITRIYSSSKMKKYKYDKIINKGINYSGKNFGI